MTVLGIALVVFVFAAVLMMANGIRRTLQATGSEENVLVLRKAANSETLSVLDRDVATLVTGMPEVARSETAAQLARGGRHYQYGEAFQRYEQRHRPRRRAAGVRAAAAGSARRRPAVPLGRARDRRRPLDRAAFRACGHRLAHQIRRQLVERRRYL